MPFTRHSSLVIHHSSLITRHSQHLGLLLAIILPAIAYLPTVFPTYCFFSDSGDFIAAGTLLSICHPPGYPLYCLLGKLFTTLIPFGEVSWRFGLLTALFVPLTGGVVFLLMMSLTKHVLLSLVTAWAVTLGETLWLSSIMAEVYSANLFLTMLTLLGLVYFWQTNDKRWFYTAGLSVGFGAAHHLTLPLMAVGGLLGLVAVWKWMPIRLNARDFVVAFLLVCLPLSFYAYLPIRAPKPYGYRYWQLTGDDPAKSASDFLRFVTAQRYRYLMGNLSWQKRWERFSKWVKEGWRQYILLFGLGLGLFWLTLRTHLPFFAVTLGMLVAHLVVYLGYGAPDYTPFFIPAWSIVVLWGGLVAHRLWALAARWSGWAALLFIALTLASVEFALLHAFISATTEDKWRGRRYLEAVMRHTPKDAALLVSADDVLFNLWVMQTVEERRRDILVVAVYQWNPLLPTTRRVVSATADIYRFPDLAHWHLRPLSRWTAELSEKLSFNDLRRCMRHSGTAPSLHKVQLLPPPDGVHLGALLIARVEFCVDSAISSRFGLLWLIARQPVKITDANSHKSMICQWWCFLQPLDFPEGQGRRLMSLNACLPIVSNALPGNYQVRLMLMPLEQSPPENAKQMRKIWAKAKRIGTVRCWGR